MWQPTPEMGAEEYFNNKIRFKFLRFLKNLKPEGGIKPFHFRVIDNGTIWLETEFYMSGK